MIVVTHEKYLVKGYNKYPTDMVPKGWILEERPRKDKSHYAVGTLIINEAKYIGEDYIYFLEKNGVIRKRKKEQAQPIIRKYGT